MSLVFCNRRKQHKPCNGILHRRMANEKILGLTMRLKKAIFYGMLLLCAGGIWSCKEETVHTPADISKAMKRYDSLILTQDANAIAMAFTPDGKLGDAAAGRANIQQYLSRLQQVKITDQVTTTTAIQIRGDSALQKGTYVQTNVLGGNDTLDLMGTYVCKWRWTKEEGWKISHIITKPF